MDLVTSIEVIAVTALAVITLFIFIFGFHESRHPSDATTDEPKRPIVNVLFAIATDPELPKSIRKKANSVYEDVSSFCASAVVAANIHEQPLPERIPTYIDAIYRLKGYLKPYCEDTGYMDANLLDVINATNAINDLTELCEALIDHNEPNDKE